MFLDFATAGSAIASFMVKTIEKHQGFIAFEVSLLVMASDNLNGL